MAISYGTYTITNIQEGSQIWTTSVAPTTPNYTFNISNLTGDSETSIKVGDIIMYDFYRYTVSNVNSDGTTVLTGDRTSIRGATGASATTYHLILSTLAIVKGSTGSLSPSSIVLTAKSQSGSNAMANYSGRFKIETTTDNSTWSTKYTSSGNEATKTYTLPTGIVAVRCSLYLAGGTTTLLDQQTVPVVTNGIEIISTSVTYQSGTSGTTKPTGTWQTTIPSVAQGNYLWTKTVVNYSDGTSTESYSVARQGNNGTNGTNGTSPTVSSTTVQYQQSTNGSTTPTGSWSNNPPTAVAGQYIWTKTTITYSDGASAVSYSVSKNGTNGTNGNSISITSTAVTYQAGTSGTTKPTGNWQTSIPSVSQGGYLWTKTVVNYSDGSSTESYSTARQGSNGTNGTNGTSPTVSSTVIEYQQATDGKNVPTGTWSTTPPTAVAGQYIWTRTTITYSDNATAVSYSVGKNGTNGNSITITSTSVTYQKGTNGTTKPTGSWGTSIPSVGEGEYLWTKTVVNYSDGKSTESYSVSRNATNGRNGTSPTVSSTVTEYAQSTDGVNKPTSGWNTTPPTAIPEQYIWSRVTVTYSDNATAVSYSVSRNGTDGTSISISSTSVTYQKGTSGTTKPTGTWQTGIPSVGEGEYLWTKTVVTYSDSSKTESYNVSRNATNGISPTVTSTVTEYVQSDSGTNKPSSGWNGTPPTAIANKYMWTRVTVTYSDGATAISYSVAKNGTNGNNGVNTATIYLYKRATSTPSVPSGNTTYTFSTKILTGTLDNWEQSIPTGTDTCYVIAATASSTSSTDTIPSSEWSTPIQFNGTDGTNGYNQATIFLYHRGASATKPSTSVTYTFSSGALSSTPTGWSRTVPAVDTDKNPCWVTTAVAISKNSSVSIASSGWATPTKMVEDGIDGIDGIDGKDGKDGTDGKDGKDAYTVSLSNDNHTFAGDTTKAIQASVDCSVIGFKGATQVSVTIGTITGQPAGMTTSITGNNTTNAYFTVSVTASMTTRNGVLTIPVTIDGKAFTKKFTYSLALKGEKGENGGSWYSGTGITGTSTTATIFSNSGITSAVVGDMYLNTTKYNTYRCTLGGNASTAKWVYVNNIKGIGISSIKNQYYLHTSSTTAPASTVTWLDAPPAYIKDRYYWTRSCITWSDGSDPTTTTPVFDNALTDANKNAEDAKLVANNYLSSDSTGIMIADLSNGNQTPSQATGRNVFINNTSVNIRNGHTTVLAKFEANGTTIGEENKGHTTITNTQMAIYANNGQNNGECAEVGVLGAINDPITGLATITEILDIQTSDVSVIGHGNGCYATYVVNNVESVLVNDQSVSWQLNGTDSGHWVDLPDVTAEQADLYGQCTITYNTFTTLTSVRFGTNVQATSANSFAVGERVKATAPNSSALGFNTEASGLYSHAYGMSCTASGDFSSANGRLAQASGDGSHAEGLRTVASGHFSCTNGYQTIASSNYQMAIGRCNEEAPNALFIIGNGEDRYQRSNAFVVNRDGSVNSSGTIKQNGTAVSLNGHNHSASNITSGTLSIERGGSGSSGVTSITTIENVAASGSGYSVTQAQFCSWGKVATIHLAVKKNSSAGSGTQTICTLKSGCRPKFASPGNYGYASNCVIATDGAITISGSVAANALLQIYATYVLA